MRVPFSRHPYDPKLFACILRKENNDMVCRLGEVDEEHGKHLSLPLGTVAVHRKRVNAIVTSPSDDWVASGSNDGTIQITYLDNDTPSIIWGGHHKLERKLKLINFLLTLRLVVVSLVLQCLMMEQLW